MEDKKSSFVTLKEPHIIAGENQVHHEIKNNDVSKGWPPSRNKLQRSASIRYVYMLDHNVLRCTVKSYPNYNNFMAILPISPYFRSNKSIVSYNAAEISSMASSQNLPAVLNDPRKGNIF